MLSRLLCTMLGLSAVIASCESFAQDVTGDLKSEKAATLTVDGLHDQTDIVGQMALVRGPNSNSFAVYSTQTNAWETLAFPKHLQVSHLSLGETDARADLAIVGFKFTGGPVTELVAINALGKISKIELTNPIDGPVVPYLRGNGILVYILSGRVYAYSGVTGTWDDIKAPQFKDLVEKKGTVSPPKFTDGFDAESTDGILLRIDDKTFEFMPKMGQWKLR